MTGSERSSPPSSRPPESDRRGGERLLACFPAHFERKDGATHTALIRDLSMVGALLLVRTDLKMGDRVRIQLFLSASLEDPKTTTGHVVRVEPLAEDEAAMWLRRVGVQFDAPLTMLEAEINALRERQERYTAAR